MSKNIEKIHSGIVSTIADGVAHVVGYMPNVKLGELVRFEPSNSKGIVFSLEADKIIVVVLADETAVSENDIVVPLGTLLEIKFSDNLLGAVVNPLGERIDGFDNLSTENPGLYIDTKAPGIVARKSVR